jgi:hypothetical protein
MKPRPRASAGATAIGEDPRALAVLGEEHKSLSAARGLAYNEAFSRAAMFLTFLSMSFVALALLADAVGFSRTFLLIAGAMLFFDFVVGVTTFVRLAGTASDDVRAIHGMNRIRNGYVQLAPSTAQFFTTGTTDDLDGVLRTYGFVYRRRPILENFAFGLSTSQGMVGIVMALVGGALAGVLSLALGAADMAAFGVAALAMVVVFAGGTRWALADAARVRAELPVLFPSPQSANAASAGRTAGARRRPEA